MNPPPYELFEFRDGFVQVGWFAFAGCRRGRQRYLKCCRRPAEASGASWRFCQALSNKSPSIIGRLNHQPAPAFSVGAGALAGAHTGGEDCRPRAGIASNCVIIVRLYLGGVNGTDGLGLEPERGIHQSTGPKSPPSKLSPGLNHQPGRDIPRGTRRPASGKSLRHPPGSRPPRQHLTLVQIERSTDFRQFSVPPNIRRLGPGRSYPVETQVSVTKPVALKLRSRVPTPCNPPPR